MTFPQLRAVCETARKNDVAVKPNEKEGNDMSKIMGGPLYFYGGACRFSREKFLVF